MVRGFSDFVVFGRKNPSTPKWIEARQEIAGAEAYEKVRQQGLGFGEAFSDAEIAEGRQLGSISNAIGTGIGVNEAGMGRVIDAGAVSQIESAAHGKAVREAASADGQSTVARADEMAGISQSGASASRDALNLLAEKMGGSVEDLQLAKELATGNNVMLSSEKLRDMNERGVISLSEQQLAEIEKNGGAHTYLQFTPDGINVGIHAATGNEVTSSDSLSINKGSSYSYADKWSDGDAWAILSKENRDDLRSKLAEVEAERGDIVRPKTEQFTTAMAAGIEKYLHSDAFKDEGWNINAHGSLGLLEAGTGGAVGGGAAGSSIERDTFNISPHVIENNLRDARQLTDRQLLKDGFSDKNDPEYIEQKNIRMADNFALIVSQTLSEAKKAGWDQAKDSDFYEETDRPDVSNNKAGQMGRGQR